MKHVLPAALFACCTLLSLAIANPCRATAQKSALQAVANGKRIFNQSCSACHDTLGTAQKSGPVLKSYHRHQPHPTDPSVRTIIQRGKGKMPAFSTLNPTQLNELVAYLKTL
jgi:mono/diheme cytochrome c family protein